MNPNPTRQLHQPIAPTPHPHSGSIHTDRCSSFSSSFPLPDDCHHPNIHEEVTKIEASLINRMRQHRQSYESKSKFITYFKIKHRLKHEKNNKNSKHQKCDPFWLQDKLKLNVQAKDQIKSNISTQRTSGIQLLSNNKKLSTTKDAIPLSHRVQSNMRKSLAIQEVDPTDTLAQTHKDKAQKMRQMPNNKNLRRQQNMQKWTLKNSHLHTPISSYIQLYNPSQYIQANIQASILRAYDVCKDNSSDMREVFKQIRNKEKQVDSSLKQREEYVSKLGRSSNKRWLKQRHKQKRYSANPSQVEFLNNFASKSEKKQELLNCSEIPANFLKTLQLFYKTAKNTQSKMFFANTSKLHLDRLKSIDWQFSDENMRSRETSTTRTPELSLINRKDLRICQKIVQIQHKRNQVKQGKKIPGSERMRQGRYKQNVGQRQVGKIIQYF